MQVMLFFLLAGIAALLVSPELTGAEYAFILPPMAFLTSHLLLNLKRKIIRILIPYAIVLGIVLTPFFQQHQPMREYKVTGSETLMLIGTDYSKYNGYRMASPFLDEYVSLKRLEGLEYYKSSSQIYSTLLKDQPDVIIDELGAWSSFEQRFPQFVDDYKEVSPGTYRRINKLILSTLR